MKNKSFKWMLVILLYIITSLIFFLVYQAEDTRNGIEEPLSTSIPKALAFGLCVFGYDLYLILKKLLVPKKKESNVIQ